MVRNRAIWWVGGAIFAICLLVMALFISGFALQRGIVAPVEVRINLGAISLLALQTDDPNCWRPVRRAGPACSTASVYNPNHYYIGWVQRNGSQYMPANQRWRKLFILRLPSS